MTMTMTIGIEGESVLNFDNLNPAYNVYRLRSRSLWRPDHPSAMLGKYTLTSGRYLSLPWNEEIYQPLSSTFSQRRLQARMGKQQFSLLVACLWASEREITSLGPDDA
jgi:hypothetical protein